ncbi:MAG: hypothetical protein AB1668_02580 [Nanoarchaeota archaeon]
MMDKDFPIYQDSYRLKISKEVVEVIERDVNKVAKIAEINISN